VLAGGAFFFARDHTARNVASGETTLRCARAPTGYAPTFSSARSIVPSVSASNARSERKALTLPASLLSETIIQLSV
jgi:hypothetical protein